MLQKWWALGVLLLILVTNFQNCSKGGMTTEVASYSSQYTFQVTTPACMFNGKRMAPGESVTAYLNSTPESTNGCVSETRTCQNNGLVTGTFAFASCTAGPRACLFNGITVSSGQQVRAFQKPIDGQCASEMRSCQDGRLSGTYTFANCSTTNCSFSGITLATGQSFNYFSSATVPSSQDCPAPFVGVCKDGVLQTSQGVNLQSNQIFPSCTRNTASCSFRGTPLMEGQDFSFNTMAASSGVNFCPPQKVGRCNRYGQLQDVATNAILDSNAIYTSCQPEPGLCQPGPGNPRCPTGSDLYLISDTNQSLCADVQRGITNIGTPLINWDCNQQMNQRFQLYDNYEMRVFSTRFCLTPSGAQIVIVECNGAKEQKWTYNTTSRQLRNGAGQCLVSTARNSFLQLRNCDAAADQRWGFSVAPPIDNTPPPDLMGGGTGY